MIIKLSNEYLTSIIARVTVEKMHHTPQSCGARWTVSTRRVHRIQRLLSHFRQTIHETTRLGVFYRWLKPARKSRDCSENAVESKLALRCCIPLLYNFVVYLEVQAVVYFVLQKRYLFYILECYLLIWYLFCDLFWYLFPVYFGCYNLETLQIATFYCTPFLWPFLIPFILYILGVRIRMWIRRKFRDLKTKIPSGVRESVKQPRIFGQYNLIKTQQ